MEAEVGVMGLRAEEGQEPGQSWMRQERTLLGLRRECGPASTLITDLGLPEL